MGSAIATYIFLKLNSIFRWHACLVPIPNRSRPLSQGQLWDSQGAMMGPKRGRKSI
jgi:hypothetical protein